MYAAEELQVIKSYTFDEPKTITKDWSTEINIPKSLFADATEGCVVRFHFSDYPEGSQVQIATKDTQWTWTELQQYVDLSGETFVIKVDELASFTDALTADEFIEALHNDGFYMKGQKFTFTGMNLYNPKTDGISAPVADDNAIDFNAPVEIYNIQGIRVNEMSAGNLYILRQGNKVAKVIK